MDLSTLNYKQVRDVAVNSDFQAKLAIAIADEVIIADPWTGTIGKLSEMYPKPVLRYGSYRRQA